MNALRSAVALLGAGVLLTTLAARPTRAVDTETYAIVDALFLQRDNDTNDRPLVVNGDTEKSVIGTPDLRFPVASGVRAFVGRHGDARMGWEVGYLGIYGMSADARATGSGNLDIAPPLSSSVASLQGASLAHVSYASVINGAEANLLATCEHVHRPRLNAYSADQFLHHAAIDWIAGFRWAGLDEQAAIALTTPGSSPSQYGVRTTSNLFGGQLGVRGRIDWDRWALEGWGKAALAGVSLAQAQAPIIDAVSGEQFRPGRSALGGDVGGIFDWNVAVVRHLGDTWSIRAGYTMLWLTGVALAPDQFNFSTNTLAGTTLVGERMVWLQGATVGLEGRW